VAESVCGLKTTIEISECSESGATTEIAPQISVVVPTFNRPHLLPRLLASLARQRDIRVEIVVVDDGSPQPVNLSSLARQGPPLRLVRQPNRGPAAARNTGARLARGPIIAFTDDDCEPRPDWARKLADAVGTGGHPTLAGGTTRNAVNGNLFSAASQDIANNLSTAFSSEPFFASNNFAVPRDAFLALEGFDESYPLAAGEDRAFCRDWIAKGWRMASAPGAVVDHHHVLTPRCYWRQHYRYGRGAFRFHKGTGQTGSMTARARQCLALVAHPARANPGIDGLGRSALVGIAQVPTLFGFLAEARDETWARLSRRDP
jgi:glycosyltransferase involved in cell wall biosynthesis